MKTKRRLFLVAAVTLLGLLAGLGANLVAQIPLPKVKLTASPALASFPVGQPVTINFALTNQGSSVALSDLTQGNLHVTAFAKNGTSVAPRRTSVDYSTDLGMRLAASLKTFAMGTGLRSTWSSSDDPLQSSQALPEVGFAGGGDHSLNLYPIDSAGSYSLSFYYQYPGPTSTFPGPVFTGRTNTVTVTFNVF